MAQQCNVMYGMVDNEHYYIYYIYIQLQGSKKTKRDANHIFFRHDLLQRHSKCIVFISI